MAPSTALCFSLLGIGLLLRLYRPHSFTIPRFLSAAVLIIASTKLVEFLDGFHFGIDAWFVRNPEMFGAVPTGRMAPMTALNVIFTASGLFALSSQVGNIGPADLAQSRHLSARSCSLGIATELLCFTAKQLSR